VYANAFEFGPRDFELGKFCFLPNFPQSHLGRRADSSWALPPIFFHSRNLRDSWADRREILHDGQYYAEFYNAGSKVWRCTQKKFQGPKTCKIEPDFGQLRSSAANISKTDEDIQNRIVIPSIGPRDFDSGKVGVLTQVRNWGHRPLYNLANQKTSTI